MNNMRKIIVLTFISLDGVMQAPGGPKEDTSGDFKYGGWVIPYFDEALGKVMDEQMGHPFDLLLGRKTYELFAGYWPGHRDEGPGINNATKYVVSHSPQAFTWEKSVLVTGNVLNEIKKLKAQDGLELQVHGSSALIQLLLANDLVDEFWLKIFPVTLSHGKRLFDEGTMPSAFQLTKSTVTPVGVIVANYERSGEVKTGSII
jgi:dihydrofolate reductase